MPFFGQWVQQVSGTNQNLNDIFCVTEDLVFAVGDNGTILKTTDGGLNWVQKTSGTIANVKKVQFTNVNVGICALDNGTIIKTVNGGDNWNPIATSDVRDISIVSDMVFYFINTSTELYKTINGGQSFQLINAPQLTNIQFISEMIGFASGLGGLHKTLDGSITWSSLGCVSTNLGLSAFYFINDNIGFKKCSNDLYKTTNGGASFTLLNNSNTVNINKLFAVNENIVWGIPVVCLLNGTPCYSARCEIISNGIMQTDICQPFKAINFANPAIDLLLVMEVFIRI